MPAPAERASAQPHADELEEQEAATTALPRLVRTKNGDVGKLCGTRANGTAAIELAWGLPNGCTAIAFLRPSSFEQLPPEIPASPPPAPADATAKLGLMRPRSHTDDDAKVTVINVELETEDVDDLR